MSGHRVESVGALARDSRDHDTEFVSVRLGVVGRKTITAAAWVLIAKATRRNHILLVTPSTNTSNVIIAFANDTSVSNDPTSELCGFPLEPGRSLGMGLTQNILVYARVQQAGADAILSFAETL